MCLSLGLDVCIEIYMLPDTIEDDMYALSLHSKWLIFSHDTALYLKKDSQIMEILEMRNQSEMIIYQTEDGLTKVNVTFEEDTVWLTIDQMATLFQRDRTET